jgi:hypothetical protein
MRSKKEKEMRKSKLAAILLPALIGAACGRADPRIVNSSAANGTNQAGMNKSAIVYNGYPGANRPNANANVNPNVYTDVYASTNGSMYRNSASNKPPIR